jgi:hypothetical protein
MGARSFKHDRCGHLESDNDIVQQCVESHICNTGTLISGANHTAGNTDEWCCHNLCMDVSCGSHGTCKDTGKAPVCVCTDGYSGAQCENDPCHDVVCGLHHTCVIRGSDGICRCPAGVKCGCPTLAESLAQDTDALLCFKASGDAAAWPALTGWTANSGVDVCGWTGVTCGNGRVTELSLDLNVLNRTVPWPLWTQASRGWNWNHHWWYLNYRRSNAWYPMSRRALNHEITGEVGNLTALVKLISLQLGLTSISGDIAPLANLELTYLNVGSAPIGGDLTGVCGSGCTCVPLRTVRPYASPRNPRSLEHVFVVLLPRCLHPLLSLPLVSCCATLACTCKYVL